jgi:hypothetical protein
MCDGRWRAREQRLAEIRAVALDVAISAARVADQGAGNRQPLALTARQIGRALPNPQPHGTVSLARNKNSLGTGRESDPSSCGTVLNKGNL